MHVSNTFINISMSPQMCIPDQMSVSSPAAPMQETGLPQMKARPPSRTRFHSNATSIAVTTGTANMTGQLRSAQFN